MLTEEGTGDGAVILERCDGEGASLLQGTEAVVVEVSPRTDVDTREVLHAVQEEEWAELHLVVHTCLHRVCGGGDDLGAGRSAEVAVLTEGLLGNLGAQAGADVSHPDGLSCEATHHAPRQCRVRREVHVDSRAQECKGEAYRATTEDRPVGRIVEALLSSRYRLLSVSVLGAVGDLDLADTYIKLVIWALILPYRARPEGEEREGGKEAGSETDMHSGIGVDREDWRPYFAR